MKKTSYYVLIIVVVGVSVVSLWAYKKYFKEEAVGQLLFNVERGTISEFVKARGEVIPQQDFDLGFPFSGVIEKNFVAEGQQLYQGTPLIKLETIELELEVQNLIAQLAQGEANTKSQQVKLIEFQRGTRAEEIEVQKVKVENAKTALEDSRNDLINILSDAYTKSDDAVRNKGDQLFNNPRSFSPQLKFSATSGQLKLDVEWQRELIENTLVSWSSLVSQLTTVDDLVSSSAETKKNLNQTKSFIDQIALAVNSATPDATISQTPIDSWRSDVASARTNVNTAINNVATKEEKLRAATSTLLLEQEQLTLKQAGATAEQIAAQEAEVEKAQASVVGIQSQIASAKERVKKATLYSPGDALVVKVWLEKGEFFSLGNIAISLATSKHKIQADISELEIGKVRETTNNEIAIWFDAFPDTALNGNIISIDQKEIIKEGDKYYRVNIYYEEPRGLEIRAGMSTDLAIVISSKENVLKIPEIAVFQKSGKRMVYVLDANQRTETEITTGISDGESIEIIQGLTEGQTVVVQTD